MRVFSWVLALKSLSVLMAIAELPSRHAAIRCRSVIHAHGSPPAAAAAAAAAETVNVRSSMELSGKPPVSLRLSIASYSARKPLPQIIRCHRNPSSSSCVSSCSEGCSEDTSKDFTNGDQHSPQQHSSNEDEISLLIRFFNNTNIFADGLVRRASLVGAATIASKILVKFSNFWGFIGPQWWISFWFCVLVFVWNVEILKGLVREIALASVIGVGPVATAFK